MNTNRIRMLRKRRGLTARVLAERADMAEPTITRIERGRRGLSFASMQKIAHALELRPSDLLREGDLIDALSLVEICIGKLREVLANGGEDKTAATSELEALNTARDAVIWELCRPLFNMNVEVVNENLDVAAVCRAAAEAIQQARAEDRMAG